MGLKQQQKMLSEMLPAIGEEYSRDKRGGNTRVTGFLAAKGKLYDHKLMVVGQAVNGWGDPDVRDRHTHVRSIDPLLLSQLANKKNHAKFANQVADSVSAKPGCPMQWVKDEWGKSGGGYNTKTSAFWRVTYRVMKQLKIDGGDDAWPSRLVWSNLYKIAPTKGGNPRNRLCDTQLNGCKKLLYEEIKGYKPKRILFLTGWDWARDFLEDQGRIKTVKKKYVCASGLLNFGNRARVVVARHPRTKEKGGSEDGWVKEIMEEFT